MIVAMQERATEEDIQGVIERLVQVGLQCSSHHRSHPDGIWRV